MLTVQVGQIVEMMKRVMHELLVSLSPYEHRRGDQGNKE